LGQRAVIAKSYARIGWQNLVNFGIPPFEFTSDADCQNLEQGDTIKIENIRDQISSGHEVTVTNVTQGTEFTVKHTLSNRQVDIMLAGGQISYFKKNKN
jgi:aconitate hydratase